MLWRGWLVKERRWWGRERWEVFWYEVRERDCSQRVVNIENRAGGAVSRLRMSVNWSNNLLC